MALTVTPDPVAQDANLTIKWSARSAAKVRIGWPSGLVDIPVTGTSGTLTRKAKEPGEVRVSLLNKSNRVLSWTKVTVKAPVPAPAPVLTVVGYAATLGVDGGGSGPTYVVGTYAELAALLRQSGPRTVEIDIDAYDLDGLGETIKISNGNLTLDGSGWAGTLKRCQLLVAASNVIIRQMRVRPGTHVENQLSGSAITINPGVGKVLSGVLIDHNSLAWATDVVLNHFQECNDITIQHNIIGPSSRRYRQVKDSTFTGDPAGTINEQGYGFSFHTDAGYCHRVTVYRNLMLHNYHRNLRGHSAEYVDFVSNVVYDWGNHLASGNFRGTNMVGNMFKPGPETTLGQSLAKGFVSELTTDGNFVEKSYYQNSVYMPDADNLAMGFAFDHSFAAGVRRTSPFGGGLHNVQAAPPTAALAAAIVAAAGPTIEDDYDKRWKAEYAAGAGGYWSEAGLPGLDIPW